LTINEGQSATMARQPHTPGRNISPTQSDPFELDRDTPAWIIDFEDTGPQLSAIFLPHTRGSETPAPTNIVSGICPDSSYLIVSPATPTRG
jgi:hypothetical protein